MIKITPGQCSNRKCIVELQHPETKEWRSIHTVTEQGEGVMVCDCEHEAAEVALDTITRAAVAQMSGQITSAVHLTASSFRLVYVDQAPEDVEVHDISDAACVLDGIRSKA
jgi:hypothetical protein